MSTRLIKAGRNGTDPDRLTVMENQFVNEMAADLNFNGSAAAKAAGYKNPAQMSNRLMNKPKITAALGRVIYDRLKRCNLTQDDVLNYLEFALFFNPLTYFRPADDGAWLISDLKSLPDEVGRMIESMEITSEQDREGVITGQTFKVKLVSKTTCLSLAMKHVGVEKAEMTMKFDWDTLYSRHIEN